MIQKAAPIILFFLTTFSCFSQKTAWDFDGQASLFGGYLPDLDYSLQTGLRYIPELNFLRPIDSLRKINAEVSLNMYAANSIRPWDDIDWIGDLNPYRIWMRYATQQWSIRAGLQKIDFGSAAALRPLQWFNQIDPRDPLQITNGVYGVLGRYYFLDNTNVWLWGLYANKERRGLDFMESYDKSPEFGGRVQFPIPKGEMAFSYHHRKADVSPLSLPETSRSLENRFGFDAKWDVEVGLWLEASYTLLNEPVDFFKNQLFSTLGIDYTFGIGNGLNVILEHMVYNFSETAFSFKNPGHFTASILTYPFSLYDQLSSVLYFDWKTERFSFFVNYQRQFANITGYLMAFYIPEGQGGFQNSAWVNAFSGPGIRIMAVYNY